jgi:hypothetical protein
MERNILTDISKPSAPNIFHFNHSEYSSHHSKPVEPAALRRKPSNDQSYSEEMKAYDWERKLRLNEIVL